jgi:hypothetical protein
MTLNLKQDNYNKIIESVLINPLLENELTGWTINAGTPTVKTKENDSILVARGIGSHQLVQMTSWKQNHVYYMQVEVYVPDYVAGRMGLQANGRFVSGNAINLSIDRNTIGWECLYTSFKATKNYTLGVYYGSINAANLNGYAKKAYLIDLTEIYGEGNEPSAADFYNLKLPLMNNGITMSNTEILKRFDKKINTITNQRIITATDVQAEQVFVQEMNKKCKLWKMNDTVFQNASGLSRKGQLSNAQDMLRLTLQAVGSEQIVKIGGAKKYSVTIKGETPRTIKVKTTVTNPALENAYLLLGGKSGTLGTAVNNASILAQVKEGTFTFVSIVMKSSTTTSRYEDTKKLLDVILKKMENPHYIPTEKFTAVSLAGVLLPNNPLFWTNLDKLPTYGYYGLNES